MQHIKVLLVDDSGFMRLLIKDMLAIEPSIEILDVALDGKEAFEKTKLLNPDVILLDLVMQNYDGLYALQKIMKEVPKPIIVLSGASEMHPEKVFEAMNAGAFDFVAKPGKISRFRDIQHLLIHKIKAAGKVNTERLVYTQNINNYPHTFEEHTPYKIIVIGASTGGTAAIETILKNIPCNLPIPILIVQHIPSDFGYSFADRLSRESPFEVKIPKHEEPLYDQGVYLAPSSSNLKLKEENHGEMIRFLYSEETYPNFNFPSINMPMISAAEIFQEKSMGVLLTGMGTDGKDGLREIYHRGGFTIAQSKESSVVFGMPKAAIEEGVVREVVHLNDIPAYIINLF
ncbi:MAG: chemotaxis-specific protein-glutamate methyltransferase CheB [Microscillaceae bacterium]|nr:chemotaxis-specific protein-glutamate methyltransferase CheB [Microscillaceae bacterium]